jgi:hypothetical protein
VGNIVPGHGAVGVVDWARGGAVAHQHGGWRVGSGMSEGEVTGEWRGGVGCWRVVHGPRQWRAERGGYLHDTSVDAYSSKLVHSWHTACKNSNNSRVRGLGLGLG